ncbi:hypothetical protein VFPPC_16006 [Pochonia chlamydosporia 170]|uniref:Uncharacterized protein n=1 Tax=Pochonia chlamydosporia 170 TaxID=1380566 RepID=A0A179FLV7_METCM|nr:hypothetical protein VFPPC_16006 [Pochonia chlamydosporia 170]OAQ66297.1 hypothetical protein VFPPC_16006 [Pochonia chlamydosporia 170]
MSRNSRLFTHLLCTTHICTHSHRTTGQCAASSLHRLNLAWLFNTLLLAPLLRVASIARTVEFCCQPNDTAIEPFD